MTIGSDRDDAAPAGATHHSSRLAARQEVLIGVKLRRRGERWFASRVTDISCDGFRLSTFVRLYVQTPIWVMFPGFEGRSAKVVWVGDHAAGCIFDTPLHPAIYDYIIRMSDPARAED